MALTKNDIMVQIQNRLGFPNNQSREIMDSGDDVLVSGFGKFCINVKPGPNYQKVLRKQS